MHQNTFPSILCLAFVLFAVVALNGLSVATPENSLAPVTSDLLTGRGVPANIINGPPRNPKNHHGDDDDETDNDDDDMDSDSDDTDTDENNPGLKGAKKPEISADAPEKLKKMEPDDDLSHCPRYRRCAGECCSQPSTPKKTWSSNAEECVPMEGRKQIWKWHTCCEKGQVADRIGKCCGKGKVVEELCPP